MHSTDLSGKPNRKFVFFWKMIEKMKNWYKKTVNILSRRGRTKKSSFSWWDTNSLLDNVRLLDVDRLLRLVHCSFQQFHLQYARHSFISGRCDFYFFFLRFFFSIFSYFGANCHKIHCHENQAYILIVIYFFVCLLCVCDLVTASVIPTLHIKVVIHCLMITLLNLHANK